MKFKLQIDGIEHAIETIRQGDRVQVKIDGGDPVALIIVEQTDELTVARLGNRLLRFAAHKKGDDRQLWLNGQTHHYTRVQARGARASLVAGSLSASIPAVVTDVLVAVGDTVSAGQKLILLESMKMVIPIQAPSDGTVTAIHCSAGESVQPGVALVEVK
jgi:biotin carboxyl carrier protein